MCIFHQLEQLLGIIKALRSGPSLRVTERADDVDGRSLVVEFG